MGWWLTSICSPYLYGLLQDHYSTAYVYSLVRGNEVINKTQVKLDQDNSIFQGEFLAIEHTNIMANNATFQNFTLYSDSF